MEKNSLMRYINDRIKFNLSGGVKKIIICAKLPGTEKKLKAKTGSTNCLCRLHIFLTLDGWS